MESAERSFLVTQSLLRILAIACSVVSIILMLTSTQRVVLFGIRFIARYSEASAFRFLFAVDAVACALSLLSFIFALFLIPFAGSKTNIKTYFFLLLHDLVMAALMMSGCAAATAIGYVGVYGQESTGWIRVCRQVPEFCKRSSIALAFSYCAFFCYFALAIVSATKLMSSSLNNRIE